MSTRRPVIGVAFARPDYIAALTKAGAEVRHLRPDDDPLPGALDGLDGVVLTGGPDVAPHLYGAEDVHPTVSVDDERDRYEIPLASAALTRRLPLLAICRGVQVMNVAAGGTLIQDVPSQRPSTIDHSVTEPRDHLAHDVDITPHSALADVLGLGHLTTVSVNSRHHQSVDQVAPGFRVCATAPDGLIEAIEQPGARFCLGVQWHPENFHTSDRFDALFAAFVRAASGPTPG